MSLGERRLDVYECSGCGEYWFQGDGTCCGRSLEAVEAPVLFDPPDVESVAREVFDVSSTELVVYRELVAAEEATVRDLAKRLSRDRSSIQRHVTHLDALGLVERWSRSLPAGGRVNVYAAKPGDEVHHRLRLGLYAWIIEAEGRIDDLTGETVAATIDATEAGDRVDRSSGPTEGHVAVNGGDERSAAGEGSSLLTRLHDRWQSQ